MLGPVHRASKFQYQNAFLAVENHCFTMQQEKRKILKILNEGVFSARILTLLETLSFHEKF
jgi:hypothetical protein